MSSERVGLTLKQEQFCQEYLVDLNATKAAIRAGYSERSARKQGSRMLAMPAVKMRIEVLQQTRNERVRVDVDYVLDRLTQIDQMDVLDIMDDDGSIRPMREWPKVWRLYVSGIDVLERRLAGGGGTRGDKAGGESVCVESCVKKVKWPDKVKNLELLGKYVGVFTGAGGVRERGARAGASEEAESVCMPLSDMERATRISALLALAKARRERGENGDKE